MEHSPTEPMQQTPETTAAEATRARTAAASTLCVSLADETVLRVSGADARSYLHSQFSSGLLTAGTDYAPLTSYSDPRGRLLAVARVCPLGRDDFALVLPPDRVEGVAAQLTKYALRADVVITPGGAQWQVTAIAGEEAGAALEARVCALPRAYNEQCVTAAGLAIVRVPDAAPRWLIIGPATATAELTGALAIAPGAHGESEWRRLDIEAGLPRIRAATAGRFVAQMVNLDCLGAVDFRKGCFPGQEVIARTRYLGRIKRRMFILDSAAACPAPGATICRAAGDGSAVGEIVEAAPADDASVALAVLRLDARDEPLRLDAPDGSRVTVRDPPYSLAAG